MVEVNPWTPHDMAESALLYRGAIVAAWGYTETWLSEVALRASHLEAYHGLRDTFPYKLESRLSFLERVLRAPGPLTPYAPLGLLLLARVRDSAELRHRMAHARARALPHWGVEFEEIVGEGAKATYRKHRYQLDELEQMARRATRLSRLVQRAAARLDREGVLPPLVTLGRP